MTDAQYKKEIIGLVERVKIKGREVVARIDTGARRCSIDKNLARELKLGPIIGNRKYRSAHGRSIRDVVLEEIELKDKKMTVKINLSERGNMKYAFLVGREALKKDFLIDPGK
ncbi:ATP-dependent zinc protease [Candidatus Woesearchaeota archaeon]|nr:ATP-dependent zinc protease [Candidatus Woesearchaeota archaeon]